MDLVIPLHDTIGNRSRCCGSKEQEVLLTGSYLIAISPSLPVSNNFPTLSLLPSQLQNYRSQIWLQSREGSGSLEGREIEGERQRIWRESVMDKES